LAGLTDWIGILAVLATGPLLHRTRRFFPSDGLDHRQYSFYHPMQGRRLSRPSWLAPYGRQSPIKVLTGHGVE